MNINYKIIIMRKLQKFIISTGKFLSVREMQELSGGSESSNGIDIYKCTCYMTMPGGYVFTKYANVKATSQSAAESGVLRNECEGYTSASCIFLSHLDGTH